jgi:hypothetical protein
MTLRPALLLPPALVALLLASGCSTVVGGACHKPQPHHTAGNLPPLKMPPGLEAPDTADAMRIPEVNQPELPLDPEGPCLDAPPSITAPPLPATPEYDLTDMERLSRTPQQAAEEEQEPERSRRRPPSRPR